MKKIKIENPKKQRSKRYLLFSAIILVVCGMMIYNAISNNKLLVEDNFDKAEGIVTKFEIIEEEYHLEIQSIEDDKKITLLNLNKEVISNLPTLKDNLTIDQKINIVFDLESKDIYKVTINDTLLYDRITDTIKSNDRLMYFYIFVGIAMIIFLTYNIVIFVKEQPTKEIDYIEHIITNNKAITYAMLNSSSKSMYLIRMEKNLNKYIMISLVIILLGSIMVKSYITNKVVLLILSIVIVVSLLSIMMFFKPKLYSKHLNTFVNDYIDSLKNGTNKEERTIILKKEGLKVVNNEQTYFFDYHDLNFFTVAAYSKTNAPVNLFICSSLPDKEEYADIKDFIIPLSYDIYQDIINNSIYIEGLEELMNNLYDEAKTSIPLVKEGILVKYYK